MNLSKWGGDGAVSAPRRLRFVTATDDRFAVKAHGKDDCHSQEGRVIVVQKIAKQVVDASLELQEQDKALYEGAWFNSNNQHQFDPFIVEVSRGNDDVDEEEAESSMPMAGSSLPSRPQHKVVRIDSDWWAGQTDAFRSAVESFVQRCSARSVVDKNFRYPHEVPRDVVCDGIYQLYCDQFSYEKFAHCVKWENHSNSGGDDTSALLIVPLSEYDRGALRGKARVCCITGRRLNDDDMDDFSPKLLKALDTYVEAHSSTGVFVKTHAKSAKNDLKLRPLFSTRDILSQLTFSLDVLGEMERSAMGEKLLSRSGTQQPSITGLRIVLLPWEERITPRNEYRVFVNNFKVRAMSQQLWHTHVGISVSEAVDAAREAIRFYEEYLRDRLEWPCLVLDVWVEALGAQPAECASVVEKEGRSQQDYRCHLIEVNPGGWWASSGSSLFEWRADQDILHRSETKDQERLGDDVFIRITASENIESDVN